MNFENVIPVPAVEPEATDYYGEDGLLYCGVCNEPKEAFFPNGTIFGGKDRHPAECSCQRKRREADEAAREEYYRKLRVRELRERCFINPIMRNWTFENATIRNKRVEQAMRYVDRWTTVREENCGLLFWGSVGTGKSFLAGCIANALLEKEVPVCMTNLAAVINHDFAGRQEYIRKLCSYQLLILDDFGMERDTSFALETVYDVIDGRYLSGKPLIVTTNLTLDELKKPQDVDHSLKTAQEQAKQQLENGDLGQDKYDALQREIIETEQELRRLQEEAASTSVALAKIDEAGKKIEAFGDSVTNAGQAIMPASMAVAGLGAAAVKTAADFDTSMSKVAAVSGATGDDLDALRDKAREMGAKTKFSASEAADAMNYMAMAGWKTGDMLEGIEGIMNLAAASGEDLATTSDIVTDALTAFGLSAQDSAHFADILAAASSNANTNVSMMGETFKYCAPIAGALGFSAEDTAEAIGLMANAGIKGSQAGTALRTIMNNLTGEIKLSGKALGDVTIATTNADGSMRDLSDILADCRGAFSQLSESEQAAAAEALVGKNAMSGFLALMNAGDADIEKLASSIDHCSDTFVKTVDGAIIPMSQALEEGIDWIEEYNGVSEQMAAVMQDNLGGQLTILKSQIQELAISFGEMLMPAIRAIVSKIQAFVDKLNNMSESQRKAILTIGLIVAALGPFLVIIGTLISKVGAAMQGFVKLATGVKKLCVAVKAGTGVFGKLGAALGGISAPVLAIVAVIAVLIAAFKHLWDTNEEFRNAITAIWEGIVSKISAFCQGIVDRLNALGFDFGSIVDVLKSLWDGLCQFLAPVFEAAFNAVSTVLGTVLDVITGLLDVFIGLFTGNWSQMWEGVKEIFSGIWDGITGLFDTALNLLKSLAETVFGWFGTTWESVWTGIKSFFETIWNGIVAFFSGIWNAIVSTVTAQINAVKTVVTTVFNAIKTTATTIWNGIKTAISTVVDGIKSKVSSVFESVKSTATNLFNGIKSTATNVWNGIKTAIITPIEAARDKIRSALDAVRGFFSGLKLELPHIKLPHFRVSGTLSISPPSVPHLSIDWYKEGGIMTKPTVFGMNGSALMAGGESGSEAILPLSGFYKQLEAMLTEKLNMHNVEKYLAVIAANSGKGIYLDDGTLVGRLLPAIDSGLGQTQKLNARLSL